MRRKAKTRRKAKMRGKAKSGGRFGCISDPVMQKVNRLTFNIQEVKRTRHPRNRKDEDDGSECWCGAIGKVGCESGCWVYEYENECCINMYVCVCICRCINLVVVQVSMPSGPVVNIHGVIPSSMMRQRNDAMDVFSTRDDSLRLRPLIVHTHPDHTTLSPSPSASTANPPPPAAAPASSQYPSYPA